MTFPEYYLYDNEGPEWDTTFEPLFRLPTACTCIEAGRQLVCEAVSSVLTHGRTGVRALTFIPRLLINK